MSEIYNLKTIPSLIGISGKIGSGKDTVGRIIQSITSGVPIDDFDDPLNHNILDIKSDWEIKKFAGKLKQIASTLTGVPVEKFEDQEFKNQKMGEEWAGRTVSEEKGGIKESKYLEIPTYRKFLQVLGTEAMRNQIHPNIWVNALFVDYKKQVYQHGTFPSLDGRKDPIMSKDYPNWIITDTRFPNELKAVKDRGGITIRVNRLLGKHNLIYQNDGQVDFANQLHESETALDDWDFDYTINNNSSIDSLIETVKDILKDEEII